MVWKPRIRSQLGNDGYDIKHFTDDKGKLRSRPQNLSCNFTEAISWSLITSGGFSVRYYDNSFLFNVAGISCFPTGEWMNWLCGLLNTKIVSSMTKIINPTLNMNAGDVAKYLCLSIKLCKHELMPRLTIVLASLQLIGTHLKHPGASRHTP